MVEVAATKIHMPWAFNIFNAITPGSILTYISSEVYLELLKTGLIPKWARFSKYGCIKMETPPAMNPGTQRSHSVGLGSHPGGYTRISPPGCFCIQLTRGKQGAKKRKTEQGAFKHCMRQTKMYATSLATANNEKPPKHLQGQWPNERASCPQLNLGEIREHKHANRHGRRCWETAAERP